MEPIEVALAALASCINVGISINALARGVHINSLETKVKADFNPGVLFSLQDLDASESVFENIEAEIEIEGVDIEPAAIDEWARRAPVYALIGFGQDIDLEVTNSVGASADD